MTLDAVALGCWKVGALASVAGLLPVPPVKATGEGTKILLLRGGADRTIPSAACMATGEQLENAGFDVTVEVFPGVGHTIALEEMQEFLQFIHHFAP